MENVYTLPEDESVSTDPPHVALRERPVSSLIGIPSMKAHDPQNGGTSGQVKQLRKLREAVQRCLH